MVRKTHEHNINFTPAKPRQQIQRDQQAISRVEWDSAKHQQCEKLNCIDITRMKSEDSWQSITLIEASQLLKLGCLSRQSNIHKTLLLTFVEQVFIEQFRIQRRKRC